MTGCCRCGSSIVAPSKIALSEGRREEIVVAKRRGLLCVYQPP